jgi:TonB-linked SusC/RagA family outer membrane protein
MRNFIIMLLLAVCAPLGIQAQSQDDDEKIIEVTGTVTDENGEPLIGVSVMPKDEAGLGAITNVDGVYKIKIPAYTRLVFNYIGMEQQEVLIKEQTTANVKMKTKEDNVIDEVVVTGTGSQKKLTLTGAVTTVDPELLRTPTASLSNSFAGVVPGVFARQTTGNPGDNVSEFWIRGVSTFGAGASALVLVDGFERDLNDINPEDIETFTVLKDASTTAIYGSRGANGVLLITTKRGRDGKTRINGKVEYSYSTRTKTPEFVDGSTYARMMNEALESRNMTPAYSADDLYLLDNQLDPEIFPNVNWMDLLLKDGAPTFRANVDVNGGGSNARYFASVSYVEEGGMYNSDSALKDYKTNANYHRWNYRMNFDLNITKTTLLKIGVAGALEKQNQPGSIYDEVWTSLMGYNAIATPVKYKNGRWGSQGKGNHNNPWVLVTQYGYNEIWKNTINTTAELTQDFGFITPGLSAIVRYGYDIYTDNGNKHWKAPEGWQAERLRDSNGELVFTKKVDEQLMIANPYSNGQKKEFFEAEIHYARNFGLHQVGAILKYTQDGTTNNSQNDYVDKKSDDPIEQMNIDFQRTIQGIDRRHQGLAGRFTYGYANRYFVDFNFGYNGSENFAKHNRFGFFPAYSAAWNLGEEPWIRKAAPWIDMFKIRYSYGKVGNDYLSTRFPFQGRFMTDDNDRYIFGDFGTSNYTYNGISYLMLANKDITWEVARKHDIGIDFYLFGNKFSGTIDYFRETRDGIFMTRNYLPQIIGVSNSQQPSANIGKVRSTGVDGNIAYTEKIGQVNLTVRGNFTYSKSKILEYDEQYSHYAYSRNSGFRVDQARGLIALGLFKDYDDIRYSPDQSALKGDFEIAPGDIKYKDVNGDGKINDNDIVPIGSTTKPNLIYGFGISAQWKGFDFNVLFQGVGESSFFINGFTVYPFSEGSWGNILTDVVGNYWSLGKNEDIHAKYPRLTYGNNSNNNRASTYWLRDGSYLRLKNLEIGYTLPKAFVSSMHIQNVRFYFMATNLLTFSEFDLWDPELGSSNGQQYPLSRTFTLGMTINL